MFSLFHFKRYSCSYSSSNGNSCCCGQMAHASKKYDQNIKLLLIGDSGKWFIRLRLCSTWLLTIQLQVSARHVSCSVMPKELFPKHSSPRFETKETTFISHRIAHPFFNGSTKMELLPTLSLCLLFSLKVGIDYKYKFIEIDGKKVRLEVCYIFAAVFEK